MNQEILKAAIAKFGRETQIDKLQEEAMELALALHQLKCPTKDYNEMLLNVFGELADMKIMMAQAELLFDKNDIDRLVEEKLYRLEKKYLNPQ